MSTQVTLTLPDETYRRAEHLAQLTGRNIADVLSDTIFISLQPLGEQPITGKPVSELSNAEVLGLASANLDPAQDHRLSELLDHQQAGILADRAELVALMQIYQEGLLRKAQALREAVRRGLRRVIGAVSISDELRTRIRRNAEDRCGYCQSAQMYVLGPLEIDHIVPVAKGGTDDEDNLWLACRMCNNYKSDHMFGNDPLTGDESRLFDPRHQALGRAFHME